MCEGAASAEARLVDDVSRLCVGLEVATTREELEGPERK